MISFNLNNHCFKNTMLLFLVNRLINLLYLKELKIRFKVFRILLLANFIHISCSGAGCIIPRIFKQTRMNMHQFFETNFTFDHYLICYFTHDVVFLDRNDQGRTFFATNRLLRSWVVNELQ